MRDLDFWTLDLDYFMGLIPIELTWSPIHQPWFEFKGFRLLSRGVGFSSSRVACPRGCEESSGGVRSKAEGAGKCFESVSCHIVTCLLIFLMSHEPKQERKFI